MRLFSFLLLLIINLIFLGCAAPAKKATEISITKRVLDKNFQKPKLDENATLMLDTFGHTNLIKDIAIDRKNLEIITASSDKSIRVWDINSSEEKRKILGKIGKGKVGGIFAIALSPDNRYLAVGGMLDDTSFLGSAIRVYDYKSGKLIKLLKSHTNVVLDLSFSRDSKYMVSGAGDSIVKVWESEGWRLVYSFLAHEKRIHAVNIIKTKDDYLIVSSSGDKNLNLYSLNKKELIKSYKSKVALKYMANNSSHIALCGEDKKIFIFDNNLSLIKEINSTTFPSALAYSPNGKFLASGFNKEPKEVIIYKADDDYKKLTSFKKHTNTTMALNFLDNNKVVSGGGENFEIYIWDLNSSRVIKKIEGNGNRVWSVGIKEKSIAFGTKFEYESHNEKAKLEKSINLESGKVTKDTDDFSRIANAYKNYFAFHEQGGKYDYRDGALKIYKDNNILIAKITKDSTNGFRHTCYGFYNNSIISGGSNGVIKIYNLKGKELGSLIGHTGDILSMATKDDILVTGSSDQSIKMWNLKEIMGYVPKVDYKLLEKQSIDAQKQTGKEWSIELIKEFWDKRFQSSIYMTKLKIYPILNLFVDKYNEWVIWDNKGYYNSSKQGANYLGFYINQGADKEAIFVPIEYYKELKKIDLVKEVFRDNNITN